MTDMKPKENTEILAELIEAAEKAPGVQELMDLYSYYQSVEVEAEPARRAMQTHAISSVSNGAYPAFSR